MVVMFFTLDTSHFEISQLNAVVLKNILIKSVTLDTSHSPISPGQLPSEERLRHASTKLSNSSLDRGENAEMAVITVCDMDPGDPENMRLLLVFEWTGGGQTDKKSELISP